MAKKTRKAHLAGAYIVKAAESRPSRVKAKSSTHANTPTSADKSLASTLLKTKRA